MFNSQILSRLEAEVIEIPCTDKVDETASTFKWSKKATEKMKKIGSKCLQEINRLRQTYRPDLPQYSVQTNQGGTQKRKRKMEGACTSELSNPPKPKQIRTDAGRKTKRSELSSPPELKQIKKTDAGTRKRKAASQTCDKQLPTKKP